MKLEYLTRPFEVKSLEDTGEFSGYGSIFGNVDRAMEIVAPGAFKKSLKEAKSAGRRFPALWNHKHDEPIGVYELLAEDETGLKCDGRLQIKVGKGLEIYELMKMKAITGLSIGYQTIKSKTDHDTGVRTLIEVNLWEVSPVTFPANTLAQVESVKSLSELVTLSDCEDWLRDAAKFDMSRKEAKQLIAQIKSAGSRDAEPLAEIKAHFEQMKSNFK